VIDRLDPRLHGEKHPYGTSFADVRNFMINGDATELTIKAMIKIIEDRFKKKD